MLGSVVELLPDRAGFLRATTHSVESKLAELEQMVRGRDGLEATGCELVKRRFKGAAVALRQWRPDIRGI